MLHFLTFVSLCVCARAHACTRAHTHTHTPLSYSSSAVKKYHDKAFHWWLAYIFRLVHYHRDGKHTSIAVSVAERFTYWSTDRQKRRNKHWAWSGLLKPQSSAINDTPSPTRTLFLILTKSYINLGPNIQNILAYRRHLHSNHQIYIYTFRHMHTYT